MTDYARRQTLPDGPWELVDGEFTVIGGGSSVVPVDPEIPNGPTRIEAYDLTYPHNWLDLATPSQRSALGIKPIAAPDSPPAGHDVLDLEIFDHAGSPKYRYRTVETALDARRAGMLRQIDLKRDELQQADFVHDFGAIEAIDDFGLVIAAGERLLQMRPEDRTNWQDLRSEAALVPAEARATTLMPMRAEDNWNIQTSAADVLAVTSAMFARNAGYLFRGGVMKSRTRAAEDHAALDTIDIEAGWQG